MAEGSIDDAEARHAKNEFVDADARQKLVLGQQAVVGRVVEIEDVFQVSIVVCDPSKHAFVALAVFRGDQAMGIVTADEARARQVHTPPRRARAAGGPSAWQVDRP